MKEEGSPKDDFGTLRVRKESVLRSRSGAMDDKLDRIDALDRHRMRSKFTRWALAVPPVGLGLVSLFRGNVTGAVQLLMMAVLLFGAAWVTGRWHERSVGRLEKDIEKLTGPSE